MPLLNISASWVTFGVFLNCGSLTPDLILFSSFDSRYGVQRMTDWCLPSLPAALAFDRETIAQPHSIAEIVVHADDDLFMFSLRLPNSANYSIAFP
jgi:hypothetical protein